MDFINLSNIFQPNQNIHISTFYHYKKNNIIRPIKHVKCSQDLDTGSSKPS